MKAPTRVLLHALILFVLYQALRLLFWWQNRAQFPELDAAIAPILALQGMRFDLSAIAMINGLTYLLVLSPWILFSKVWHRWICFISALLLNAFSLGINLVDVEYYKFTGKRLTADAFAITQDIGQQFTQIASYYWFNSLLLLGLWTLVYWSSLRLLIPEPRPPSRLRASLHWVLAAALIALAIRGGWQTKPLIPAQAFAQSGGRAGVISLNSTFTLLKSSHKASVTEKDFFNGEELKAILDRYRPRDLSAPLLPRPKNVVIIILESFSQEYVLPSSQRPSYAPFLYSLMQKGSTFPLAFANGRRSIDALPAILAGVPAWMEAPYITSPYQTNELIGLAQALPREEMESSFYHGGKNGTMFFDLMAKQFGFDRYLGETEYPHQGDHDGQWGIFDEPFLEFAQRDLSQRQKPFLATLFTLTSHHPYRIPEIYAGRFPKGTLEIHESIGYADYALQRFYEAARQQPWFADTLFVLTADHTSKSETPNYETPYGRFAVPLVFIYRDAPLPFPDLNQAVQHADIMPTVLDIFGVTSTQRTPFGQSLLRPLLRPGVLLYENESYYLVSRENLLHLSPDQLARVYRWPTDPLLQAPHALEAKEFTATLEFMKAQIQAYNNGMVRNRLIW